MLKVKLLARGNGLTPYVSAVQRSGRVQKAFANQIGKPAGACVRGAVHRGMSLSEIRKAVGDCGRKHAGTKLNL